MDRWQTLRAIISQLLLVFWLSGSAYAQPISDRPIQIGVQDFKHYAPYSSYQNWRYQGFNRDLLDLFAQSEQLNHHYQPLPLPRLYRALVDQDIDLKYPDNPNWNSAYKKQSGKTIHYSKAVVSFTDGLLVPRKHTQRPIRRIGVLTGFTLSQDYDQPPYKDIKVLRSSRYATLIKQLEDGDIDAIYANIDVTQALLKNQYNRPLWLVFNANYPHHQGTRHLSSSTSKELIDRFNEFLQAQQTQIQALKALYSLDQAPSIEASDKLWASYPRPEK